MYKAPVDGEQNVQTRQCAVEKDNAEFHILATSYGNRNVTSENSPQDYISNSMQPPLPTLDLPKSGIFFRKQGGKPACRTIVHK